MSIVLTSTANGNRASFYLPRCETLRLGAGLSRQKLAAKASVDRETIKKIELNHPVTELVISKVFDALNSHHAFKLERKIELTDQLGRRR